MISITQTVGRGDPIHFMWLKQKNLKKSAPGIAVSIASKPAKPPFSSLCETLPQSQSANDH